MVLLRFALERYGPRTRSCRRVVVGGGSHFALVGSLFSIRVDCGIYLAKATSVFFDCLASGRVPFGRDFHCFFQLHRICGRTRKHGWMGIHSVDFRLHDPITDLCHSGLRLRPRDMEQIKNANELVQLIAGRSNFRWGTRGQGSFPFNFCISLPGELGVRVHFLSIFAYPYHAPPAKKDKNTPKGPWCPLGLLTFGLEKL